MSCRPPRKRDLSGCSSEPEASKIFNSLTAGAAGFHLRFARAQRRRDFLRGIRRSSFPANCIGRGSEICNSAGSLTLLRGSSPPSELFLFRKLRRARERRARPRLPRRVFKVAAGPQRLQHVGRRPASFLTSLPGSQNSRTLLSPRRSGLALRGFNFHLGCRYACYADSGRENLPVFLALSVLASQLGAQALSVTPDRSHSLLPRR